MRIDTRDSLAGVPMLRIRDLLRSMRGSLCGVYTDTIAAILEILEAEAASVVAELIHRQLIAANDQLGRDGEIRYQLTGLGNRMASANGNKPMKRATAERLLGEFQSRIEPINQDSYYLYRISRVVLFGSYLTGVPTLGDIDLIVHLQPKEQRAKRHKHLCEKRNREFMSRGWSVSWMEMYAFYETLSQREVYVALRNRSSYLSFHPLHDEVVIEHQPQRVIYGTKEYVIPESTRKLFGVGDIMMG